MAVQQKVDITQRVFLCWCVCVVLAICVKHVWSGWDCACVRYSECPYGFIFRLNEHTHWSSRSKCGKLTSAWLSVVGGKGMEGVG